MWISPEGWTLQHWKFTNMSKTLCGIQTQHNDEFAIDRDRSYCSVCEHRRPKDKKTVKQ